MKRQTLSAKGLVYAATCLIIGAILMFLFVDSSWANYRLFSAYQENESSTQAYLPIISRAELTILNPDASCVVQQGEMTVYEAENGSRTDNVQILSDDSVSNSQYLHVPEDTTNPKTFIQVCFEVTTANWYTLQAAVADNKAWSVQVNDDRFDWTPSIADRFASAEIVQHNSPYRKYWEPGTYTVTFWLNEAAGSLDKVELVGDPIPEPTATATPEATPIPPTGNTVLRINAGWNEDFTDSDGNNWSADSGFVGGNTANHNVDIQGEANEIFTSERWGMSGYSFDLANAQYSVKLLFTETYIGVTGPNQRVFTVDVEGQSTDNIDVWQEAGGRNRIITREIIVDLTDEELDLTFNSSTPEMAAIIKAIEVVRLGDGPDPIPPTPTEEPPSGTAVPSPTPSPTVIPPTATPAPPSEGSDPFYGIEYLYSGDFDKANQFGFEVILQDFNHSGNPQQWLNQLNAAEEADLQIIAWVWPPGHSYKNGDWEISSQMKLFLETVHDHPALFAVYGIHEPNWNGCFGCGYTTAELQKLYRAIKDIRDVPIFNDMDELQFWVDYSEETTFADGVCDYCATWYYPSLRDGTFQIEKMRNRLESDLRVIEKYGPNSQLVWIMQGFSTGSPYNKRMPTAAELKTIAEVTFEYKDRLGGMLWYPWEFSNEYDDTLNRSPELFPTLVEINNEIVQPSKQIR